MCYKYFISTSNVAFYNCKIETSTVVIWSYSLKGSKVVRQYIRIKIKESTKEYHIIYRSYIDMYISYIDHIVVYENKSSTVNKLIQENTMQIELSNIL